MIEFHDLNPAIMSNCEATRREDLSAFFAFNDTKISQLAVRSLLYEVSATPKPGLVDRANNGAHKDMCFETFLDSSFSLGEYFSQCFREGRRWAKAGENLEILGQKLRRIGLEGEKVMFEATGGINTHKGVVFSLGIFTCVVGMMSEGYPGTIQDNCRSLAEVLLHQKDGAGTTHGKKVLKETGIGGIREEALSGFDSAFSIGFPELMKARSEGCSMNVSMVRSLMKLIAVCDDSNVVYRGGVEGLRFMQNRAKSIMEDDPLWWKDESLKVIMDFDQECIERNLSPGGCADLLALSVMIYFVNVSLQKRG